MSDLIDRQVAIDDIWTVSPLAPLDREWIDRWLMQLPPANNSETPNSSDTISRAKAIDALNRECRCGAVIDHCGLETAMDIISELPPAQPAPSQVAKDIARIVENGQDMRVIGQDRIRGHWIPVGGALYQCDQCGAVSLERKFCSDCGADMREVTK